MFVYNHKCVPGILLHCITKATNSCKRVNRWLVDFEDYGVYDLSIIKERGYET